MSRGLGGPCFWQLRFWTVSSGASGYGRIAPFFCGVSIFGTVVTYFEIYKGDPDSWRLPLRFMGRLVFEFVRSWGFVVKRAFGVNNVCVRLYIGLN